MTKPPELPTKVLGKTGLRVTTLGAGCAWLGRRPDGSIDQDMGVATILAALEAGIRLIDTASMYAQGKAEVAVGEALRQRQDLAGSVVVETKVRDVRDFGYTADETRRSVETSLQRLRLDHIDVVYIHDPPADALSRVMAADGALAALRQYQSQGLIGHVGIASNNPWDNAPYVETGEFEAAVVPDAFSLISQVARERIFPAAERFGMGVVVATPLERGLLATGARALRPEDNINRSFSPDVLRHVERLEAVCAEYGVTLLAAALQYVVRHPLVTTTIPGFRSPDQPGASVAAMLEPTPEPFWAEIEPMVRDFKVAVPPG
ncbi:MAG: aldo/keto reductase [Chloroflexi bacterium]|nr:aldo/keto reductase [Chloroflexota bacterium]